MGSLLDVAVLVQRPAGVDAGGLRDSASLALAHVGPLLAVGGRDAVDVLLHLVGVDLSAVGGQELGGVERGEDDLDLLLGETATRSAPELGLHERGQQLATTLSLRCGLGRLDCLLAAELAALKASTQTDAEKAVEAAKTAA